VNTFKSQYIFYGIRSSVTSIAYNNVLPDVIGTHIVNPPVSCNITYLHIFEIFNLFIPFFIGVDSSFVLYGMPCRLAWFVFVGIGGHLGSSRQLLGLTGKSTCRDRLQTDGLESPESRAEQEEQRTK
jgi:hypothetical protein